MSAHLSHLDASGSAAMVDVSAKSVTRRTATACGEIRVNGRTLSALREGQTAKGDVLGAARLAAIMAAKQTASLIPLCHPLALDHCALEFTLKDTQEGGLIEASCTVALDAKTGAEMEALTGVAVALLTIYDMCKALDRAMVISNIRLTEKTGGKSGRYQAP